ncbi:PAS domain-containing protein [uncultured Trichococcus sp.]|nr:PAS domain-containing protein [uncultured Trichococcus sp.]
MPTTSRDGKFITVTYRAVRDDGGSYMGTLEYVQDIQPIIDLDGEKQTLS